MPAFLFSRIAGKPLKIGLFYRWNKYNPIYNLQTMKSDSENAKLDARGNMTNKNDEFNKKRQEEFPTGAHGGLFEIHVKGQLDETWSDWLEGLEVKLLENGEMILSGNIGDQAALMGVLNKLYGLNLTLLSVNQIKKTERKE
jgi:hypothetical protein